MCICWKYEEQEGSKLCKNCWQPQDPVEYLMDMFWMSKWEEANANNNSTEKWQTKNP